MDLAFRESRRALTFADLFMIVVGVVGCGFVVYGVAQWRRG